MFVHKPLSSYLVPTELNPTRHNDWSGFRTLVIQINRKNPRIIPKTLIALFIWTGFFASVHYVTNPHMIPGQATMFNGQAALAQPAALSTAPAKLATAVRAQTLTSGPSGQLLPPGQMAPQGTYANNYARGQCTWYVAGRRQIPPNWGNARSWLYHASATGWNTGTTPAIAAVAWTSAGTYGHVALVENISADGTQVFISEMNYRGLYVRSTRWVSASSFKYIY